MQETKALYEFPIYAYLLISIIVFLSKSSSFILSAIESRLSSLLMILRSFSLSSRFRIASRYYFHRLIHAFIRAIDSNAYAYETNL